MIIDAIDDIQLQLMEEKKVEKKERLIKRTKKIKRMFDQDKTHISQILELEDNQVTKRELSKMILIYYQLQHIPVIEYKFFLKQYQKLKRKIKFYQTNGKETLKKRTLLEQQKELNQIQIKQHTSEYNLDTILQINKIQNIDIRNQLLNGIHNVSCNDEQKYKDLYKIQTQLQLQNEESNAVVNIKDRINKIDQLQSELGKQIYGLHDVKEQLVLIFNQKLRVNDFGTCFLLQGPQGIGKTTICQIVSQVMEMPFIFIALSGMKDQAMLKGHSFTYIGSQPGIIIKNILQSKTNGCVILFDELDKCSEEIQFVIMQLTDRSQNTKFLDDYSQIPVDLSKCIFMFTCNNQDNINPILLNRMEKFQLKDYSSQQKLIILRDYSNNKIPQRLKMEKIEFDQQILKYIIDLKEDKGMRFYEQKLERLYLKIQYDIDQNVSGKELIIDMKYVSQHIHHKDDQFDFVKHLYL